MEGVQENVQQPEHATIVRIDSVRFGDEEMANRVKLVCIEATGEFAGTTISFWCNLIKCNSLRTTYMVPALTSLESPAPIP
ncbi:MAG TPA: hypothetical protein VNA27_05980 [Rubrobacteraceae bacterium]|nr:hypothetical protein [Rubrobacteraceae bacterium]